MSTTTAADQFIEEGILIGRAEGEARGEAKGEANAIIVVLKARFGKVQKSTNDAVRAITDLKTLEKLTELAATCDSLNEFNKALN